MKKVNAGGNDQEQEFFRTAETDDTATRELAVLLHHLWARGEVYGPLHNTNRTALRHPRKKPKGNSSREKTSRKTESR